MTGIVSTPSTFLRRSKSSLLPAGSQVVVKAQNSVLPAVPGEGKAKGGQVSLPSFTLDAGVQRKGVERKLFLPSHSPHPWLRHLDRLHHRPGALLMDQGQKRDAAGAGGPLCQLFQRPAPDHNCRSVEG